MSNWTPELSSGRSEEEEEDLWSAAGRGLEHPRYQPPQHQAQSYALTVLLQGWGCYCTVPQLDAGGNGKLGQKPRALVRDLACEYKHELLLPVRACTPRSSRGPVLLPSPSSGAASRRAEWATTPPAGIPTFREGIWAIAHKPEQRELWFPPSAITPKFLLCHPAVRKEREECGSDQGTTFWGQDPVVYLCSLYSDKGGNTTLPPKLYNMNICSFPYLKAPLISIYF